MDDKILKTVHSILGESVQIVDCEKTSSAQQEEILLVNGVSVTLDGHAGEAIKNSLLIGEVPSVELLNQLLYKAGILKQPVQLETSLSVKSSVVTTEKISVARGGQIVEGRSSETKEDYTYNSSKKETWIPIATKTKKINAIKTMSNTPVFESNSETQEHSSTATALTSASTTESESAISDKSFIVYPNSMTSIPSSTSTNDKQT